MSTNLQSIIKLSSDHLGHDTTKSQDEIIQSVGDLSGVEMMGNQVLVGIYIRPKLTKGGIIRPDTNRDEDKYQGKAFLILKKGPLAFVDGPNVTFSGQNPKVGDWVVGRVSDGWALKVNTVECRMFEDIHVKMIVSDPEIVW